MNKSLKNMNIAILAGNAFSEADMIATQRGLLSAGAKMKVVSVDQGLITGMNKTGWGHNFPVDVSLSSALASDFDMLVIPGGDGSCKKLLSSAHSKRFVGGFMMAGKPLAAFNDGVTMVLNTQDVEGVEMTGPETMMEAINGAGAEYVADTNAVISFNVISGGMNDEKEAFVAEMISFFASYGFDDMDEAA